MPPPPTVTTGRVTSIREVCFLQDIYLPWEAGGPQLRSGQLWFLPGPPHEPAQRSSMVPWGLSVGTPECPLYHILGSEETGPGWREEKAALMPQGAWG